MCSLHASSEVRITAKQVLVESEHDQAGIVPGFGARFATIAQQAGRPRNSWRSWPDGGGDGATSLSSNMERSGGLDASKDNAVLRHHFPGLVTPLGQIFEGVQANLCTSCGLRGGCCTEAIPYNWNSAEKIRMARCKDDIQIERSTQS